jgi:ElaB/YqjD/DUF883 family membrane-anchored ribosome-binding protein
LANNGNSRADAERAVKDMQKDFDRRIDAIKTELKEKGPEAVEKSLSDLKAGFEDRFSDVTETIDNARESIEDAVEGSRTAIQNRPLLAVGAAVAFGVLLGMLVGPRRKD